MAFKPLRFFGLLGNRMQDRLDSNKELDKLYQLPRNQLGLAQTLFNARMPGASDYERNILSTQGGTLDYFQKNASDPAQAIAAAAKAMGITSQQFGDLRSAEGQYKQQSYQDLISAQNNLNQTQSSIEGAKIQNSPVTGFFNDAFQIGSAVLPFFTGGMGGGGGKLGKIGMSSGFGSRGYGYNPMYPE